MNVAQRFGANLAYLRSEAGLSQEALGFLAGLHRTEISLLERGTRVPRVDTLVKLAGALDLPAERLLHGIDWRPASAEPGRFGIAGSFGADETKGAKAQSPNP